MTLFVISDMLFGVILAFSAIMFWERNNKNQGMFMLVLAALFNYLYSFFRVLEQIKIIPSNWYFSVGNLPLIKYLIILFSMIFFILGLSKFKNEKT